MSAKTETKEPTALQVMQALRRVYLRLFEIARGAKVKQGEIEDLLKKTIKGEEKLGVERTIGLLEQTKKAWLDEGKGCPMCGLRDIQRSKKCMAGTQDCTIPF